MNYLIKRDKWGDSGVSLPRLILPSHTLELCELWANYFLIQCLSFFICKRGIIIVPTLWVLLGGLNVLICRKCLGQSLGRTISVSCYYTRCHFRFYYRQVVAGTRVLRKTYKCKTFKTDIYLNFFFPVSWGKPSSLAFSWNILSASYVTVVPSTSHMGYTWLHPVTHQIKNKNLWYLSYVHLQNLPLCQFIKSMIKCLLHDWRKDAGMGALILAHFLLVPSHWPVRAT